MPRLFAMLASALFLCGHAVGQSYAHSAFRPPETPEAVAYKSQNILSQETLEDYLAHVTTSHEFTTFEGQNEALKAAAIANFHKTLQVASGFGVDMSAQELFDKAFADGSYDVYLCAVTSRDAEALRLCVDLSGLAEGDEVWVADIAAPRAFGPYAADDNIEDGRWLPMTDGDTAVLFVRTLGATLPEVRLTAVSHFFWDGGLNIEKTLSCNNDISCEGDEDLQDVSTGVGRIVIPSGYSQTVCSGCLLNNETTSEFEPYFLTANHCLSTATTAAQSQVIWDYRTTACNAADAPSVSSLPSSDGESLLATSGTYDLTLIELDEVPDGAYGRIFLGWDVRDPEVAEDVITIHHPQGSYMRISYGHVTDVGVDINMSTAIYRDETEVLWTDGITEAGSSGACLLFDDGDYRVFGTLSGGPTHSCVNTSNNYDYFSSFRSFYPQVKSYLAGGEGEGEGEGEGIWTGCPGVQGSLNGGGFAGTTDTVVVQALTVAALLFAGARSVRRQRTR